MAEGLTPHDDFADDGEFDHVEEVMLPIEELTIPYNGFNFTLTPANAAIRWFFGDTRQYSRVVVYPDEESRDSIKLDDNSMQAMVRGGFPIELPDRIDEADREFMESYVQFGIDQSLGKTS